MGRTETIQPASAREPLFPPRVFVRLPVVMELLFGLSPLAGIAWWGWDVFLVLMLHLLALVAAALFLALRMLALSNDAVGYFITAKVDKRRLRALLTARFCYTAFYLFVFLFPLALMIGMLTEQHGGIWLKFVGGLADYWQVVVISSGLWIPLAGACAWEAASFILDSVVPRLALAAKLRAPTPPLAGEVTPLSPEVRTFLYVRALVIVRMLVTVLAVGIGMFVGELLGALSIVILLVVLKTTVAVFIEASANIDFEKRAAAIVRGQARPTARMS